MNITAGVFFAAATLSFGHGFWLFEKSEPELRLVRVAPTFFQVRLFSKFEEREFEVVDDAKKVTHILIEDSGAVRVVDGRSERLMNDAESFQFPAGTYRVIPRSHASYGRAYRGSLSVGRKANAGNGRGPYLELVLRVSEEDYLASVVACERVSGSGLEAQKALAVCARSFARYRQESEGKKIFSDLTEDQVFKGPQAADDASLKACRETGGLALVTREGLFFPAYYSSSAGRSTTTPGYVWGRDVFENDFQAVNNVWTNGEWLDQDSPHTRWTFQLPRAFISELFPSGKGRPEIKIQNGKMIGIVFDGKNFTGWNFRQAVCLRYGWASMKSLECRIEVAESGAWNMNGAGLGHGVGLSIYGSARLAGKGLDFRKILAFYFPKLKDPGGEP